MKDEHIETRHYEYVFGKGYPVHISVAINRPNDEPSKDENEKISKIELFKFFINYNDTPFNDSQLDYFESEKISFTEHLTVKHAAKYGILRLEQILIEEIGKSENDFVKKALPLKERELRVKPFKVLQTTPNFQKIKKFLLQRTSSIQLKDIFEKLDGQSIRFLSKEAQNTEKR